MYTLGDFVEMKKPHACIIKETGKKANRWQITRLGADIKIKCSNCDHVVMMSRHDFEQKMKISFQLADLSLLFHNLELFFRPYNHLCIQQNV